MKIMNTILFWDRRLYRKPYKSVLLSVCNGLDRFTRIDNTFFKRTLLSSLVPKTNVIIMYITEFVQKHSYELYKNRS